MVSSLSTIVSGDDEEINNLDKEYLSKKRNMMKMAVFLLCQFINAFDKYLSKKVMIANTGKVILFYLESFLLI